MNQPLGEKMILDVELYAKPVEEGQFWIITDGEKKVGNVCANHAGFGVEVQGSFFQFTNTKEIERKTSIKFLNREKNKTKVNVPYPEYPTTARTYNSVFDVKRGLHVFTKTRKSKCFHAAGWFVVEHNGVNQVMFCPKYIFIQRYPYQGPFKTENEAKIQINT